MRAHNRGLFRKLLVMTSVFLLVIFAIVALITYQSITQTQRSFERSVRAQEETADSSGMFNVHRRLRIRCGEGSGVQVQRSAMGGLQVTVRIRPQGKSASKEE